LRAELRRVAQAGYAVDREECGPGNCCVGAPVFGADGSVTEALAVMTTTPRFTRDEARLVATTQDIARAASFAMGADPSRHLRQVGASSDDDHRPNGRRVDPGPDAPNRKGKVATH
jgi:hypothetical protein